MRNVREYFELDDSKLSTEILSNNHSTALLNIKAGRAKHPGFRSRVHFDDRKDFHFIDLSLNLGLLLILCRPFPPICQMLLSLQNIGIGQSESVI